MTFSELNLNSSLVNALDDLGYKQPTTIQEKAFSVMMSGQDVVGIAQTGTGKTIAYLLPCLRLWNYSKIKHPQILILVPTRELVMQVVEEAEKLTKYMNVVIAGVYGGTNIKTQMKQLYDGVDVVVATPGRLLDLALNGSMKMKTVKKLVIDEVDEMLNLGFRPQLIRVLDLLSQKRQNLMFSATMTEDVKNIIEVFFNNPKTIEAARTGTPLEKIQQSAYYVPNFNTKANLLSLLLEDKELKKVLIFAATKKLADQLFEKLDSKYPGKIGVIHSNKSQNFRFNTVKQFQEGNYRAVIATDIMARGLDISEVTHVINFDVPEVPEDYIHRIGRTGRADKDGIAITFITEKEIELQENIESLMDYKIPIKELPDELVISDVLTFDEIPKVQMKEIKIKQKKEDVGPAFHEKLDKNKKVNKKVRRVEQMKEKYGKPKTRGQKRKPKK